MCRKSTGKDGVLWFLFLSPFLSLSSFSLPFSLLSLLLRSWISGSAKLTFQNDTGSASRRKTNRSAFSQSDCRQMQYIPMVFILLLSFGGQLASLSAQGSQVHSWGGFYTCCTCDTTTQSKRGGAFPSSWRVQRKAKLYSKRMYSSQ